MHSPLRNWVGSGSPLNMRAEQKSMHKHSAMVVVCPLFKNGSKAATVIEVKCGTLRWGEVIKQNEIKNRLNKII